MVLNEYLVRIKGRRNGTTTDDEFLYRMDKFKKLYTIKDLTTDLKAEAGVTKNETWKIYTSKGIEVKHLKDCSDGIMVLTLVNKLPNINNKSRHSLDEPSPRHSSLSNKNANVKFPSIRVSADANGRAHSDPSVQHDNPQRTSRGLGLRRKQSEALSATAPKLHLTVPNSADVGSKKTKTRSTSRSSSKSIKRNTEPVDKKAEKGKESLNEGVVKNSSVIKTIQGEDELYTKYDPGIRIGDGNFAKVYKVTLLNDQTQLFALKKIYTKRMKNKSYYIENEADLLNRCKHPNIIRLIEAFKNEDHYYLVLEYVQNGDLFDNVKTAGHFDELVCAGITSDVSHALHYLHHFNVVHRDIKPENLFLTVDFRAKLGDFGLACKALGPLYRVCGTPTYVAPEVLAETGYSIEVDMWSLGVILYIMLCGYAPFRNQDRDKLFQLIQAGHYEFDGPRWKNVSEGAKNLVSKLLVLDASKRATASQVLKDRWIRLSMAKEV